VVLARVAAVLVDLADADLDAGVVLGLDDTVGRAALAWDVARGEKKDELDIFSSRCSVLSFRERGGTRNR